MGGDSSPLPPGRRLHHGPYAGNPVAVVLDAEGVDDELMQRFAAWTNLSETTFVLPPDDPAADYRLRIFTPSGSCRSPGTPRSAAATPGSRPVARRGSDDVVVQECGAGLVPSGGTTAGSRSRRRRSSASGPVDEATLARVWRSSASTRASWSTATGSTTVPAGSASCSRAPTPSWACGPETSTSTSASSGPTRPVPRRTSRYARSSRRRQSREDPVTGSLNAGLAEWLLGSGRLAAPYTARQGTALGRTAGSGSRGTPTAGSGPAAAPSRA